MEPAKIYNVYSKRMVTINGVQYNKLLKEGYTVSNNQLLPPILSKKSVKSVPITQKSVKSKTISVKSTPTLTKSTIDMTTSPLLPNDMVNEIITHIRTPDLLTLCQTNKQFHDASTNNRH